MPFPQPVFTFLLRCHEDNLVTQWSVFERDQPVLTSTGVRVPAECITVGDDIEVSGIRFKVIG